MIERTLFSDEHNIFRESVRRFLEREIAPHHARWEEQGIVDRSAWLAAGKESLLCMTIPEQYGGAGLDRLYPTILIEELARNNLSGPNFPLHSEIVAPYLLHYGTEEQKLRWLPPMARGEVIGAVAMTEPSGGSDLAALRTSAVRDGDDYIINGQKTFISNGHLADLIVVAARTTQGAGAKGVTLLLVEGDRPGFKRGRKLDKIGLHAQDTAELFFDDVRVPATNVLGEVDRGFICLMQELAWERTSIAIRAAALCEHAIRWTTDYTRDRQAFGQALFDMQHTRFKLADWHAQTQVMRVFVDRCIELVVEGKLDANAAAVAKFQATDLLMRLLDDCVQMHGGYGFTREYLIGRTYSDSRYMRIAGGSNEIMRELIARTL
ncbi:acyl-CoA dehydrogenase [Sphingopyxis lindanitolerans]|uniref:Acyl-[acyl-carrier-protein] dehydrogenase MbtN n=1 Tax=Sphingopyxis lindanitolerans TaxID=2054227 RepID=A0A2S8B3K9_9SPHN|nr:acyl-CoA dehydrogenase family protein [Sphingopyxis lindanitolerans]PQM26982.1 acyl-CoA dehydrogenase [Sphingopyxis lindanitolerans]